MAQQEQPGALQPLRPVSWSEGGCVLLDQRKLPAEETYLTLESIEEVGFYEGTTW